MAEHADAKSTPKPARSWATRAEAIAVLALALAFIVWVGVIVTRQRQAGRGLRWTHGSADGTGFLVDLNRADAAELMLLPGIGPGRAERIVNWRKEHGPFHSLEEMRKASGLPAKDLEVIKSLVTLDAPSPEPLPDSDYAEPEME